MIYYEIAHIVTNIVLVYAIYLLMQTFSGEEVYNKKIRLLSYIIFYIISTLMIFVTRIPAIMFVFNMISIFLISLNYKTSYQRKITSTSFTYGICVIIELAISGLFYTTNINALTNSEFSSVSGLVLIRLATLIIAFLINRIGLSHNKDLKIHKTYYFAFTFISIGTINLFLNSLNNKDLTLTNVLVSGATVIGINILLIFMDQKIYESITVLKDKERAEQQNLAYENQNSIMKQTNAKIKKVEHDMKNHLQVLSKLYEEDKKVEVEEYSKSIIEEIESMALSNTKNLIIDSIVNFKLLELKKEINIKIDMFVPYEINIMASDLTTILSNILDNAIRGARSAKNKEIDLKINYKKSNLIIVLKNTFDGNIMKDGGIYRTTKLFKKDEHGLGISNVKDALKKYNGTIDIEHTTDIFSVTLILPVNRK